MARPTPAYRVVKRTADIVVSALALVVLALPLLVICIVVRLESHGPALLRQERIGLHGKPFPLYKIRTMYEDAWDLEKYLTPEQIQEWERERKVEDDPRVTRIGRFLRSTSIDEVPQFLNSLIGTMSCVGPRPITREELEWYGDDVDELLSVKPGITGYWQVRARNDASYESGLRQAMELRYVREVGLRLDVSLFAGTFLAIIRKTGK